MRLSFEWDAEKAQENRRKHGVSFEEGLKVLSDPLSITIDDPDHSANASEKGRVLVVSYTERGGTIRIISCRKATPNERKRYEERIDYDQP